MNAYTYKSKEEFKWPEYDESVLIEEYFNLVIQINGKKRGLIKAKKKYR